MAAFAALFGECTSKIGSVCLTLTTPLDKAINDRSTIVPALKFFAGIAQLIKPGATLVGRVAALQFANYADHFDNLGAIQGLALLPANSTGIEKAKTCFYAICASGMTFLILRDVGLISLKKASHYLSHLTIFQITPLRPLVAFGLDRIFLVSLIAGYSFSLYQEIHHPGDWNRDRVINVAFYTTAIVAKTAMVSAGILFPASTTTLVILTTVAAGVEAVKKYRAIR